MEKIVMDMSMSLDGFIAATNDTPEQPLGEDGQRLHAWYFKDDAAAYHKELEADLASVGAVIIGRRTYENAHASWGGNGPLGSVPCLVLAHAEHVPPKEAIGPVFTFVSDGIASALAKAKALAGDKDIALMGATVQQQFVVAGLSIMTQTPTFPSSRQSGWPLSGTATRGVAQAQNLRDSGVSEMLIGNREDSYKEAALASGFQAVSIPEAAAWGDVVFLLIPDEEQPQVFREQIAPHLPAGAALVVASGYNVAFQLFDLPDFIGLLDTFSVSACFRGTDHALGMDRNCSHSCQWSGVCAARSKARGRPRSEASFPLGMAPP